MNLHRRMLFYRLVRLILLLFLLSACVSVAQPATSDADAQHNAPDNGDALAKLRLAIALTPQELADFQPAVAALDEAHPEWTIELEIIPQQSVTEKLNAQLAGNDLPDLIRIQGLLVQQWIRRGAFLDLTPLIENDAALDLSDFYPGPLDQYTWNGQIWGVPDTAAPEVVYYNKQMFDAAGLAYPTDDWTYTDMREAALRLTLDAEGRLPVDSAFDPQTIVQWGWNGGITYFWQRHMVRGLGVDFCTNADCTLMNFTARDTIEAVEWWASLTHDDYATLYDPYGGSQTGVPGDPFISGKAAMGYNGFFAVGQLNAAGNIDYDIVQPFLGVDGKRYAPLSTFGYVIAANTEHPEAAWGLLQELVAPEFLAAAWGNPGHSVPARRSVADSIIHQSRAPANQEAIIATMEYAEVFKPYTSSAFQVYGQTVDLFAKAMSGEIEVAAAMEQIEATANEILANDRAE